LVPCFPRLGLRLGHPCPLSRAPRRLAPALLLVPPPPRLLQALLAERCRCPSTTACLLLLPGLRSRCRCPQFVRPLLWQHLDQVAVVEIPLFHPPQLSNMAQRAHLDPRPTEVVLLPLPTYGVRLALAARCPQVVTLTWAGRPAWLLSAPRSLICWRRSAKSPTFHLHTNPRWCRKNVRLGDRARGLRRSHLGPANTKRLLARRLPTKTPLDLLDPCIQI
jgi:hypothetical protein